MVSLLYPRSLDKSNTETMPSSDEAIASPVAAAFIRSLSSALPDAVTLALMNKGVIKYAITAARIA